jgi:putative hydrolase of the HAD superfamily
VASVILWDFDGTLARREGMWRGCLVETLDEHEPGHGVSAEALLPHLRTGFPWDAHERPHPELSEPDAWWREVEGLLARALRSVGVEPARAAELATLAHARYVDCAVGWSLFDDTVPVLTRLRERGWRHVVLSNHVPELEALVAGLGLGSLLERVLSSALIGYEKPHPEAFATARSASGHPSRVWMVGDNPVADVAGAEAAGIDAILVRTAAGHARRRAADLYGVESIVGAP